MTKASRVVFAEMHWTPFLMQQAEDRCHRNSQKQNVTCYYMFGEGTLDNYIYDVISQKFNVVSNIIDGNFEKSLNYMNQKYEQKVKITDDCSDFFWTNKNIDIEEMVDEAINEKIYGDMDNRDLIREIIQTEIHGENEKRKEMELKEKKEKEILEEKNEKKKKKKFGIKQYFRGFKETDDEIKTKKLKMIEDFKKRNSQKSENSNLTNISNK